MGAADMSARLQEKAGSNAFENQRSVGPSEPKGVRQGGAQRHAPRRVGHVIEIASRVLMEQVGGRGRYLIADRQHRENRLHSSAAPSKCPVMDFVELIASFLA